MARTAQARWPGIKVVRTSGFPDSKINDKASLPYVRLLSKPYRRDDLAHVIDDALKRGEQQRSP